MHRIETVSKLNAALDPFRFRWLSALIDGVRTENVQSHKVRLNLFSQTIEFSRPQQESGIVSHFKTLILT